MHSLPIFVRLTGIRVLLIGTGPAAEAKARLVEGAGGVVVHDLPARIAFVALDDPAEAEAEATRLRGHGLLVNVVDRPALCDFTVPAIVDRSPVILAVGTGGASASLAKALRERLEALLPAGLGGLASAIFAARAAVAVTHPTIDARRRLWDAALAPGGALDPLADHDDATAAVAGIGDAAPSPELTEIVLTSPDPDDLTLRQLRLLNQADTIFHDAAVPPAILARARRDADRFAAPVPATLPPGRTVALHLR
nr:siroheme synthase [Polymorphobacter sp.]